MSQLDTPSAICPFWEEKKGDGPRVPSLAVACGQVLPSLLSNPWGAFYSGSSDATMFHSGMGRSELTHTSCGTLLAWTTVYLHLQTTAPALQVHAAGGQDCFEIAQSVAAEFRVCVASGDMNPSLHIWHVQFTLGDSEWNFSLSPGVPLLN